MMTEADRLAAEIEAERTTEPRVCWDCDEVAGTTCDACERPMCSDHARYLVDTVFCTDCDTRVRLPGQG